MDQNGGSFSPLCGKVLFLSTSVQIFKINDLKYGHSLKQLIDIWFNGHGDPEDFMQLIICVFPGWWRQIKRNV